MQLIAKSVAHALVGVIIFLDFSTTVIAESLGKARLANVHAEAGDRVVQLHALDLQNGGELALLTTTEKYHRLLVDYDSDFDIDIIALPLESGKSALVFRNDLTNPSHTFTALGPDTLPVRGPIHDFSILDRDQKGRELIIAHPSGEAELWVYQFDTGRFKEVSKERGFLSGPLRKPQIATEDLNGDGLREIVVHSLAGIKFFLQDQAGKLSDISSSVEGLGGLKFEARELILEDFNRDGSIDLFVAGAKTSKLFLNLTPPRTDTRFIFADRSPDFGIDKLGPVEAAVVHRSIAECDFAIDLVLTEQRQVGGSKTRIIHFPDNSAGMTFQALTSSLPFKAPRKFSCVEGTPGPDHLIGHREVSVLRGNGGDDHLEALAGVTVMRGGTGKDTFNASASGVTLISLPLEDIEPGKVIRCNGAHQVIIDSPLDLPRLKAAGIIFENCFHDPACDSSHESPRQAHTDEESDLDCHSSRDIAALVTLNQGAGLQAMLHGLNLGFISPDGIGFGSCDSNADCFALGLNACRTATGGEPEFNQGGRCYPSDFDGLDDDSLLNWCLDPFWARLRYDQLRALFDNDGRRLVVPLTFWLPRSDALDANGNCTVGHPKPNTVKQWHDSVVETMNTAAAQFGAWGITFDYRIRTFTVPADSDFVVDPDTDSCRIDLSPTETDPNSVENLVAQNPSAYLIGELNAYLNDEGGTSWSASSMILGEVRRYVILKGGAGPFGHEGGHALSLPHPYDNNISASGTDPGISESRDSWLARAFPDELLDRLHLCTSNADCNGIDAGAGQCFISPGAAAGFCNNLKKDCAYDGDHVCDTPWDGIPCFAGVESNFGAACTSDTDCNAVSTTRGTSFLNRCFSGFCLKVPCITNADCGGGTFCADGSCVNWKAGTEACCDLYTDTGPGFDHNRCYERQPDGDVVQISGVGPSTAWPYDDNLMAYHKPVGRKRTVTVGQRDQAVCYTSYRKDWGPLLLRIPRQNGEPCSLRPGDDEFSYGDIGVTQKIPHGSCASGVCQLTDGGGGTTATCVASSCADNVVGVGEASLDCGGVCGPACPTTRADPPGSSACESDSDCISGRCRLGICAATCSDGEQNGSELGVDVAGSSFDPSCPGNGSGGLCRFTQDCIAPLTCSGDANCIESQDCPINAPNTACDADSDCRGTGTCLVISRACNVATCFSDAGCPSGNCLLPTGRCSCEDSGDCPGGGNSCGVFRSICLDQCVDGRCLGTCELGF